MPEVKDLPPPTVEDVDNILSWLRLAGAEDFRVELEQWRRKLALGLPDTFSQRNTYWLTCVQQELQLVGRQIRRLRQLTKLLSLK